MQCFVPFCKSTREVSSSREITYHSFPSNLHLRNTWIRALGINSPLPDTAMVCSQHFLNNDVYETERGSSQIHTGAIPSTVLVCMICLDTENKLLSMSKYKLEKAYENLTGYLLCDIRNLKRTLCIRCAQRLINFSKFRDKSLRARTLMMDLVQKHELITIQHIKQLDRVQNQLNSNFIQTNYKPNHFDVYIQYTNEMNETEIDQTAVIIKKEHDYYSILVDKDPIQPKMEVDDTETDSGAIETELSNTALYKVLMKPLSDEGEKETEDVVKSEIITFECTVCFKEFNDEDSYYEHMMTSHLKHGEQDGVLCNIQIDNTPLTSTNTEQCHTWSNCDSILTNDNRLIQHGAQTYNELSPSHTEILDIRCSAVPLPTLSPNNEKTASPIEETNIKQESEDIIEVTNEQNKKSKLKTPRKICKLCPYVFENDDDISSHMIMHTTRYDDVIPNSSDFVVHRTTAKRSNMFPCKYCELKCERGILAVHMATQHGIKLHSCKLCDYKSHRHSTLVNHIRTHTGEKPFACTFCKYKSARRCTLAWHMRRHTGDKPFACKLCSFKCMQNSALSVHMRTHTGDRPYYSCNLCEYKCMNSRALDSHMRHHL